MQSADVAFSIKVNNDEFMTQVNRSEVQGSKVRAPV